MAEGFVKTAGRRHESGNALLRLLVALVVLGLGSVVGYLASEINHRHYRLVSTDGWLVVERGRFLPMGFEPYKPDAEALRDAYAPVPLPPSGGLTPSEVYGERGDLDRAIFTLLSGWARNRIMSTNEKALDLASTYLERAELLPALAEEQRNELHRLRGELAYHEALTRLASVGKTLQQAREQLQLAAKLGAADPREVDGLAAEVDRVAASYQQLAARLTPGLRTESFDSGSAATPPPDSNHPSPALRRD
jgi:hypothetical protein